MVLFEKILRNDDLLPFRVGAVRLTLGHPSPKQVVSCVHRRTVVRLLLGMFALFGIMFQYGFTIGADHLEALPTPPSLSAEDATSDLVGSIPYTVLSYEVCCIVGASNVASERDLCHVTTGSLHCLGI